ncbi:flagellar basal body protein [Desulfovibrio aminophilus]|nr:flagellar basal body protein [Desulfovibrio aminophilus]MCM0753638.1 flagellar basal body protein [Desulfovibrio aminophilus]
MNIDASSQALGAFSVAQQVTANNIANVNTEGFRSSRVDFETTAEGGVAVADVRRSSDPGPQISTTKLENDAGRTEAVPAYVQGSNTDIAHEMVSMGVNEAAFNANASAVRAWDQMTGNLLDMVV